MSMLRKFILILLLLALIGGVVCSCTTEKEEESAPIQYLDLIWGAGVALPEATDFVQALPDGYTIRFAEDYRFSYYGEYTLTVIVTDPKGRETSKQVGFTLIEDDQDPVISGVKDLSIYVGDGVSYRAGVTVSDNCSGPVSLHIDSSAVDITTEGSYPVHYIATDAVGNSVTVTATVYVYLERITEEILWGEIDRLIRTYITSGAPPEQQARQIYSYVYNKVSYAETSDKNDWVRAAYEGVRTGQGDCFTYFALSKAFFIRLGIETKDVQRTEGIVDERHYWNMINIGSHEAPRWYHFDACRIRDVKEPFGCLLTDAQIAAFSQWKTDSNGTSNYFYAYAAAAYPATDPTVITPTPYD